MANYSLKTRHFEQNKHHIISLSVQNQKNPLKLSSATLWTAGTEIQCH